MKLLVKDLDLNAGGSYVAVINEKDATALGVYALDRIKIKRLRSKKYVNAVIDISVGHKIKEGELGLFDEVINALDLEDGIHIEIEPSPKPLATSLIKKKLDGYQLNKEEYLTIINDIVENKLSEVEITYFVAACHIHNMSLNESKYLTEAVAKHSTILKFNDKIILDKHCIGGLPNNRTTMIVVPIIATAGYKIPKTSSRAISSAAGTSDVVETLAPVKLTPKKVKEIVKKTNGCMIWESSLNPSGADAKLIKVRHPLRLDPQGMLLASILAKKKIVGATHVLIDIPIGETAKIKTKKKAKSLSRDFIKLGKMLGMKIKVIITDGSQPIGNGVGPTLEARDVLSVLHNDGPSDLRDKAIQIATELLKMAGERNAHARVLEILESGQAYSKFKEIIQAQGGRKNIKLEQAKLYYSFTAKKNGTIKKIDNKYIAKVARLAGSPQDFTAGLYIRTKVGEKVKVGEELMTIYANIQSKLNEAKSYANQVEGIEIH